MLCLLNKYQVGNENVEQNDRIDAQQPLVLQYILRNQRATTEATPHARSNHNEEAKGPVLQENESNGTNHQGEDAITQHTDTLEETDLASQKLSIQSDDCTSQPNNGEHTSKNDTRLTVFCAHTHADCE